MTRYQAEDLKEELLARAKEVSKDEQPGGDDDSHMISDDTRKESLAQIQHLLKFQYVQDSECMGIVC